MSPAPACIRPPDLPARQQVPATGPVLSALAACQSDPGAKAFKARLVGRGKKKMQANVAVMRKMLTVAWAIMKDPEPYDSARLYADLEKA